MPLRSMFVISSLLVIGLGLPLFTPGRVSAKQEEITLHATLTGAAEIPGPGDPDGTGTVQIVGNVGRQTLTTLCYRLSVAGIGTPTAAHIHQAPAGVAGPIVVPLDPPIDGSSSGCVRADPDLVKDILTNPEKYYVNVHNAEFPAGALRGQLVPVDVGGMEQTDRR
jgi:hypothetical protein